MTKRLQIKINSQLEAGLPKNSRNYTRSYTQSACRYSKTHIILLILLLFLLPQCSNKKSNNEAYGNDLPVVVNTNSTTDKATGLIGEWEYNNSIWYSARLILKQDGHFAYYNTGCLSRVFTEGNWVAGKGNIFLTSYSSYKPVLMADAAIETAIDTVDKKHNIDKRKQGYLLTGFITSPPVNIPGPNDTICVYFDNVQLQFLRDSLYYTGSNTTISGHVFSRRNKATALPVLTINN